MAACAPARTCRGEVSVLLAPLGIGLVARSAAPSFAERVARPLELVATVSLVAATVPILLTAWPAMVSLIGNGTFAAFATFIAVGLATEYLLGGPSPADRTVLALSTASRHRESLWRSQMLTFQRRSSYLLRFCCT